MNTILFIFHENDSINCHSFMMHFNIWWICMTVRIHPWFPKPRLFWSWGYCSCGSWWHYRCVWHWIRIRIRIPNQPHCRLRKLLYSHCSSDPSVNKCIGALFPPKPTPRIYLQFVVQSCATATRWIDSQEATHQTTQIFYCNAARISRQLDPTQFQCRSMKCASWNKWCERICCHPRRCFEQLVHNASDMHQICADKSENSLFCLARVVIIIAES